MGLELVLSMAIGFFGGRWLDRKFDTKFLAFVGLLVGVYAGFRTLFKAAKEMQKEADREALEDERKGASLAAALDEEPAPKPKADEVVTNARGTRDGDAPS